MYKLVVERVHFQREKKGGTLTKRCQPPMERMSLIPLSTSYIFASSKISTLYVSSIDCGSHFLKLGRSLENEHSTKQPQRNHPRALSNHTRQKVASLAMAAASSYAWMHVEGTTLDNYIPIKIPV
jgi:hypothetical protein